jgi:purine-binding chemotaxis protein CheW
MSAPPSTLRQYCTFHLAPYQFAVDVAAVQEVGRHQVITPVPLAPPAVRGLMNLRGQVVTAIDLRRRLGLEAAATDAAPTHLVVRVGDSVACLLVDRIGEVRTLDQDDHEPTPESVRGPARAVTTGVYKLDGALLLVLDVVQATQIAAA